MNPPFPDNIKYKGEPMEKVAYADGIAYYACEEAGPKVSLKYDDHGGLCVHQAVADDIEIM